MVVRQMRVNDIEAVVLDEPFQPFDRPAERERILRLLDQRMRKVVVSDLRLQLVPADVRVMRVVARGAQRLDFGECGRGGTGPAISRG